MYKVFYDDWVMKYLSSYFNLYREYYENLYEDSWIWSEDMIIEWYINESKQRKNEIIDLLDSCLSEESILWKRMTNSIVLKWKTKYLFIDWKEHVENKQRIITNIDIR
jgi:hypothetical protein